MLDFVSIAAQTGRMRFLILAMTLMLPFAAAAQTLRMGVQSAFVVDPHLLFLSPNMATAHNLFDSFVGKDAERIGLRRWRFHGGRSIR